MTKKELRKLYSQKRLELTATQRTKFDDLLLIRFQQLSFENVQLIMSYSPMEEKGEMDTHLFTRYLHHLIPGMQVCYPVIEFASNMLTPVLVEEETLFTENAYGIEEPVNGKIIYPRQIDLVFVPLLAFDKRGYRVGYGKGFYDRFLKECRSDIMSIGFSYFDAVDCINDANQFDVPLNFCITPQNLYEF